MGLSKVSRAPTLARKEIRKTDKQIGDSDRQPVDRVTVTGRFCRRGSGAPVRGVAGGDGRGTRTRASLIDNLIFGKCEQELELRRV